jgi:hypothetical protein
MDEKKQMNRRDFLKIVGISTVGATAAFYGCTTDKKKAGESTKEVPVGKMTYRQFPPNEDKVSLLGYGCMRWPTLPAPGGRRQRHRSGRSEPAGGLRHRTWREPDFSQHIHSKSNFS